MTTERSHYPTPQTLRMDSEEAPANERGVIARSRSRYKGHRPDHTAKSKPTQPEIQLGQLQGRTQCASSLVYSSEVGGHHAKHGTSRSRAIPLALPQGIAENAKKKLSFPKQSTRTPNLPSDDRANETLEEASLPGQKRAPDPQRTRVFGRAEAKNGANKDTSKPIYAELRSEEVEGHFVTKKLSLEFKAPQECYGNYSHEHLRKRGGEIEETHGQLHMQPLKPSERFRIEKQVPTTTTHIGDDLPILKPSTLQKRSLTHKQRGTKVREALKRTISAPMVVEPAESSVKPAFDAPVSAVNAGERRVRVHFNEHVLSIPVFPSTTPLDIIREASSQLSTSIDPEAHLLLESFKQLGLERPLRRYEHARDVLNSWDDDLQNTLDIVPSPTGGADDSLDLKSVLQSQPGDTSVHIYHSNAPRVWDKRWITLRSDGQVVMMKRGGKGTSNICHISDFDIYIPTKRQMAKKIKSPKKYCFAVKSQQKSAMFLTTENFVHFFAAGDKELAMVWYKAVQEWRSWYLVNIMGKGQKDTAISGRPQQPSNDYQRPTEHQEGGYSLDRKLQPIDIPSQHSQGNSLPVRSHGPPHFAFTQKLSRGAEGGIATVGKNAHHRPSIIQHQPLPHAEQEPFAAQSLLGRTYTQRQNAVAWGSREQAQEHGVRGHCLKNEQNSGGDGLQRKSSQRTKSKPLLDLTPEYREPPQHQKRGRGFLPEQIPVGGLVKAATTPSMNDPSWAVGANLVRSQTNHSQHTAIRQTPGRLDKMGPSLVGGLLSSAQQQDQGSSKIALGTKTEGRSAKEPLQEAVTEGPWVKGSLLDRVHNGNSTPSHGVN